MPISAVDLMSLLNVPGVGTARVRKILATVKNVLKTKASSADALNYASALILNQDQLKQLPSGKEKAFEEYELLRSTGTHILSVGDDQYPASLLEKLGNAAPLLLLCRGNLDLMTRPAVGFCGSRSASEKGIATAWDSATSLAQAHVNVVSGYAAGVDLKAHQAALGAGGTTTVVLAEGLLRFKVKKDIQSVWDESRTLVISEFGAKGAWSIGNAMQRNKTICALSQALILIEAREQGGSIEAGKECLKLKMPLFAAVYEGSPDSSKGNEAVLGIGAQRLMKSRKTNLPNINPVLNIVMRSSDVTVSSEGVSLDPRRLDNAHSHSLSA